MVNGTNGTPPRPRVGVLSLQGDFECHARALAPLGVDVVRVTMPADLERLDALVIPGGESTTMLRLLEATGLRAPLETFVATRPVLGTCAGLILMARDASALPAPPLAAIDIVVERNAYGRQIDSFDAPVDAPALGAPFQGVFIRAPRIRAVGAGVEVVATRLGRDGGPPEPVGVRAGHAAALCFHPELTGDARFHRWFLTEVAGLRLPAPAPVSGAAGARP